MERKEPGSPDYHEDAHDLDADRKRKHPDQRASVGDLGREDEVEANEQD